MLTRILTCLFPKGIVKCRKFRFRFIILPDFMIEYQYQFREVFIVIFPFLESTFESVLYS